MLKYYSSWAERNGFADWALAILWIFIAFLAFQMLAGILFFVIMLFQNNADISSLGSATEMLAQNFDLLFIANSTGQILFLALGTLVFCTLQISKKERPAFLRFNINKRTLAFTFLALLSIVCIQPLVWFLGWVNSFLPSPEFFDTMQMQQMNMLQTYLTGDNLMWLVLFHIAVVPAICEEILFRGYVLRSFQRSWGAIAAVIVSGIIFGMFHLQLTHLLPLATIGMLLGFLTWISESIIPAMAAHFLNNAGSVFLVRFYPNSEVASTSATTLPPIWLILISMAITGYILYFLYENRVKSDPLLTNPAVKSLHKKEHFQ